LNLNLAINHRDSIVRDESKASLDHTQNDDGSMNLTNFSFFGEDENEKEVKR